MVRSPVFNPHSLCRIFLGAVDVTTNQSTGVQSHQIIPMVMLVDPTTSASSVNSIEGAELRTMVIGKVGSVGTMVVAFVEATTIVTAVLRVDKTGLE